MTRHSESSDILTGGTWVLGRGRVMRWVGPPLLTVVDPDARLCECGDPATTERAKYCAECRLEAARACRRRSYAKTGQ